MGKPTYFEMLQDPWWQRRKTEIQIRDNFTCPVCDETTKELHVHHQFYESGKLPWDYTDDQLILLCADCHEKATTFMALLRRSLSELHPVHHERVLGYVNAIVAVVTKRILVIRPGGSHYSAGASDLLFSLGFKPLLDAIKEMPAQENGTVDLDAAAMRDRFKADNKVYRSED